MNLIRNIEKSYLLGSEPFQTCAKEFSILTDTIWRTYNGKPLVYQQTYARSLSERIDKIPRHNNYQLDKEDIQQQLAMYWLKWYNTWQKTQHLSLRGYLIRRTLFDIADWLAREGRIVDRAILEVEALSIDHKPGDFDLHWLFYGSDTSEAFANLTRYERYLLYLRFLQEKTVGEISEIVFRHRNMVSKDLVNAISKIRRTLYAEEDTGGSCNGGDGCSS